MSVPCCRWLELLMVIALCHCTRQFDYYPNCLCYVIWKFVNPCYFFLSKHETSSKQLCSLWRCRTSAFCLEPFELGNFEFRLIMNSLMDHQVNDYRKLDSFSTSASDVSEPMVNDNSKNENKQLAALIEWLSSILPSLKLSKNASEEELRACLIDGTVLCQILDRLRPGSITECVGSDNYSQSSPENVKRFLAAMDNMRLPRFQVSDIEQGPMKNVVECLLTLRAQGMANVGDYKPPNSFSDSQTGGEASIRLKLEARQACPSALIEEERRKSILESKFQHVLRSPILTEPSAAQMHHVGHKFHEVFHLKQGCYADLPPAKVSEMMKSNSLDNAPTQSLLSVMNGILDESSERKNGEIPHHVACLLRKVARELERRICTQAEHLRTQSNLFKAREEKYQSRIRALEALAIGTSDETRIAMNQLQEIKAEKTQMEEKNKLERQVVIRLTEEKDQYSREILSLRQELEVARMTSEKRYLEMKAEAKETQQELEERLKEVTQLLTESRHKVKELEAYSEKNCQRWSKREHIYQIFMEFQLGALRELKSASQSIKQEILKTQKSCSEEFQCLGVKIRALADASENYDEVLAENRKMYNELQDLKGNIRVYCRIRPFLPGQTGNKSAIEYVGKNGELVVVNPSAQGKDGRRSFKFNKVYDQAATQADVFYDTQPLIRSVLDGYNVCIFAYGQTGAGKTYTMTGPDGASEEEWGVNYRALNDLFHISRTRSSFYTYDIGVQMVEIYNEQVRDLLSNDGPQKRLGILSTSQNKGLAVPDACMHPVESTSDVLKFMETGLKNRAKNATALNERSSRSHSVVTIHVRGMDLKAGASLHGSLHLVDLAGSERVDRSEVTGDRLREAQNINKSLSALGDVIFALAQKSPHVPYRNSKLTQLLQSSLGGQAKTLMFVQLNPDVSSYSETVSTLKFAERVSGVELGAARSSKEGREVTELMEQVASFKDIITKKDEEINRLRDLNNTYNGEKRSTKSLRHESSSPGKNLMGSPQRSLKSSSGKGSGLVEKSASDQENFSENSGKYSEGRSHDSIDHYKHEKGSHQQPKAARRGVGQNFSADAENLEFSGAENEGRLSDLSDSGLSMGTDTDCSVESNVFPEGAKPAAKIGRVRSMVKIPRTPTKGLNGPPKGSPGLRKSASGGNLSTGLRKSASGSNISVKPPKRWH